MSEKILVSGCFLGLNVRYDGGHQLIVNRLFAQWQEQGRLIAHCPEVAGGLSIPRKPAEINQKDNRVITIDGEDVTDAFLSGAEQALLICRQHKIRYALLKESSPSCGSQTVYDGSFKQRKIAGQGITARLLSENGIKVFSENTIEELARLLDT